jgi:hypothetical protein
LNYSLQQSENMGNVSMLINALEEQTDMTASSAEETEAASKVLTNQAGILAEMVMEIEILVGKRIKSRSNDEEDGSGGVSSSLPSPEERDAA